MRESQDIRRSEGKITRRELFKLALPRSLFPAVTTGNVPFGKVKLDGSRCTGCGLCALDCPTGALTVSSSEETDSYSLLFGQELCSACGGCVNICPEKCLQLECVPEPDTIDSPPVVLFQDKIARCLECGSIIGSKAMISVLKSKMMASNSSLAAPLELCPACKIRVRYAQGNNRYVS
jgi:ferredoxin